MVHFRHFLNSIVVAVLCGSFASASPWPSTLKHSTHRTRDVSKTLQIEVFHPTSTFETFNEGIDHPLSKRDDASLEETALAFVKSHLQIDDGSVAFRSGFEGEVSSHAFVRQIHDGIPFANAVANVALNKANKVVAFGSSFVKAKNIASSTPSVTLESAIATAEQALSGKFNEHPATLEFLVKDDDSVVLTHVMQIQNEETGTWFEAFVDAHTGELVSITDFVAKASYRVLPFQEELLTQGFQVLTDPQDLTVSPEGWHSDGTTSTTGNNAISFKGAQTATTSQSSPGLNFIFVQNPDVAPTTQVNVDAARVNTFYIVNTMHDLWYRYGFTEVRLVEEVDMLILNEEQAAFNFQNNNFGNGGRGNDRVTISVQDANGIDNADFATPPDGQSGRMRMFLWDLTNPMRDGALENDIVVHENTHGLSNRLTGGGTGRCLQTLEAGGMGEGWSDAMADWTEKTSAAVPDEVLGQYVIDDPAGIRSHPYSTSADVNPLRYSSLQTLNEVHDIGEVSYLTLANILHNVYAALVDAHGFSATAKTNPGGSEGNIVHLHLFLDALALQPCNPTFLTARDAWIQADVNRFNGANRCILWNAFASRGLGVNAANHRDDTTVPSGC
ncbi:putative extracellular elastinolytic metalloproteinase precursor [Moniliophthora roreri]|nr:putative extracellular elastinolytic metalloproteinase precursor [Moniliophthora roreri]